MVKDRLRIKKIARAKKIRKDYEYRRNVFRSKPLGRNIEEVDILIPSRDKEGLLNTDSKGNIKWEKKGTKEVVKKYPRGRASIEEGVLPPSRKNKIGKAHLKKLEESKKNSIKTITNK